MTDHAAPSISIIMPHRNDWIGLTSCVSSLVEQKSSVPGCEIIVVDNGSADRAAEERFIRTFGQQITFLSEPEPGAACARNRGVAAARGGILLFIDSDCRPSADWVAALAAGVERYGCCGGRILVAISDAGPSAAEAFEKVFAFRQEMYIRRKGFSVTANLGVRKEIFCDVGAFRQHVSEDLDWCQRARAKGYAVAYCPEAAVWHPARPTLAALRAKWCRLCREEVALQRLHGRGRLSFSLRALSVALSPFPDVAVCLRFRDLGPAARLKATAALFHIRWYRAWRYLAECA